MKRKFYCILLGALLLVLAGCGSSGRVDGDKKTQPTPPGEEKTALRNVSLVENNIRLSGYNHDIVLSPDGKKVAFSGYNYDKSKQDPDSMIVLADLTTGEAREIKTKGGVNWVSAWLNDGKSLLFTGNETINILLTESGEEREIEKVLTHGAISPDGKTIAYTVRGKMYPWDNNTRPKGEAGLWLYDIASGNKKQLTKNLDEWYPVWYPDGNKIFYFCDLGQELGDGAGHLQGMASISIDGGKPEVFPQKSGKFRSAAWIVPEKALYIHEGWDDGEANSILNLENDRYVFLGEGDVWPGAFKSVAVDVKNGHLIKTDSGRVEIIDVSGKILNQFDLPEKEIGSFNFTVSPRGDSLSYVQGELGRMGNSKIKGNLVKLIALDGNSARSLTSEYKYNEDIIWDRDGDNVISLQMEQSGDSEIISAVKVLPIK